ncbi:sugar ABC transporter ATP-binding protein [Petroclostridium sp. X23]|uniref:sugar ABC transporter ATP-binding protein n=1 Tax=Petroclostridium sp. X23 TaxID=3045146 RepID=UPI0024ADF8B0|nr:sugar ABC transporter ATP-binding protein [Petroclostridium sp. X23]WHH60747.1 sugar ABC transporter ATP-binding protein [Petroclostridium sp. X23]
MYLLEMQGISKRFAGVTALDNVNLYLKENEILSVLGGNGAGKSTLMKILTGNYPFDDTCSGKIILSGKEQRFSQSRDAENTGIVMIYQEINLQPDLNAAENIFMGIFPKTRLGTINYEKIIKDSKAMLESLSIHIDVTCPVRNYGASIQQLICIARALVRKPKVLVLDEPTSCLTESEAVHLLNTIRNLKSQGISSIYISHKLDEVTEIADRIMILRDAQNVSSYSKEEFNSNRIVEDMIGRKIDVLFPKIEKSLHEEILSVKDFTVEHPYAVNKNIVEGASFNVRRGEVLGLAGLVGSGRTELLKAIFGAIPKKTGKVYIDGKECVIKEPSDALKNGIGLLPEDRKKDGAILTMSIKHNMTISILKKISKFTIIKQKSETEISDEYQDALSIKTNNLNNLISSLSGGNQQKTILSKLLMAKLKILFLDEPTRGIDIGAKNEIYKIIGDLAAQGMAIVVISSELPELLEMCDRFIVLSKGQVKMELNKDEATEHRVMLACSGFDDSPDGS